MAQNRELIEAYLTIGRENAAAWQSMDGSLAAILEALLAFQQNQTRALEAAKRGEEERQNMLDVLTQLQGVAQEHQQILAMLGDLQEQVARLGPREQTE